MEWLSILGQAALAIVATFVIAVYVSVLGIAIARDRTTSVVCMLVPPAIVMFMASWGSALAQWQVVAVLTFGLVCGWLGGQLAAVFTGPRTSTPVESEDQ